MTAPAPALAPTTPSAPPTPPAGAPGVPAAAVAPAAAPANGASAAAAPPAPGAPPAAAPPATPPEGTPPAGASAASSAASPPSAEKLKLLRERQAFEAQRTEFEAQKAAIESAREQIKLFEEARKSKNPLKVMQAAGFSADEIGKFLVSGAAAPEGAPAEDPKLSALEQKLLEQQKALELVTKAEEERKTAAQRAEEKAARDEAIASLAEAKDALPWVNALGQGDAVIAEMTAEFKKTGQMPDLHATAKAVEERIAKQMPAYMDQLVAFPAVRTMLEAALAKVAKPVTPATTAAAPATPPASDKPAETPPNTPEAKPTGWTVKRRTLSNDLSASPAAGGVQRPKSEAEIWSELQRKFKSTPG